MAESLILEYRSKKTHLAEIRQILENSRTLLAKRLDTSQFGFASDYLAKALDLSSSEIISQAIRLAESDVEKARRDAREEAAEVLKETA